MSVLDIQTKTIRDEGSPGTYEPVDKNDPSGEQQLKLDPFTGQPEDPPRNAWPSDAGIVIRQFFGGDYTLIERLKMKSRVAISHMEEGKPYTENDIQTEGHIHFAVMVDGFEGLSFFEDPRTRVEGKVGTGRVIQMPPLSDMKGRLEVANRMPTQILAFVNTEIGKMMSDPLEGTVAVNGSRSASKPSSTRRSSQGQRNGPGRDGNQEQTPDVSSASSS